MKIKKNNITFYIDDFNNIWFKNFWILLKTGLWEPDTFQVFDEFISKKYSYIDIGAWIGATALYGCQLAKHCYAIEPDPEALKILHRNMDLNPDLIKKITLFEGCLGDNSGLTRLGSNTNFGDSMSSLLFSNSNKFFDVQSFTFEEFVKKNKITDCNFIKMDIEGGEIKVLPSMKKYLEENKPTLFLSLHPFWFQNKEADCKSIIDILSIYPQIYNSKGKKIELSELLTGITSLNSRYFSIIATTQWSCYKRIAYSIKNTMQKYVYFILHPAAIPVFFKHKLGKFIKLNDKAN